MSTLTYWRQYEISRSTNILQKSWRDRLCLITRTRIKQLLRWNLNNSNQSQFYSPFFFQFFVFTFLWFFQTEQNLAWTWVLKKVSRRYRDNFTRLFTRQMTSMYDSELSFILRQTQVVSWASLRIKKLQTASFLSHDHPYKKTQAHVLNNHLINFQKIEK